MKIWVRPHHPGLDRRRRAGVRAVLTVLAAGSVVAVVAGPAGTMAASAQTVTHATTDSSESHGDGHDHEHRRCDRGPENRPSNPRARDRDARDRGRCTTASHKALVATVVPPRPPAAPHPITAVTTQVPAAPAPRPRIVVPRPARAPTGQQPPVLAPPGLTGPSPGAVVAVTNTPASIYVITVSARVVATAISIAALVLVRRSD